MWLFGSTQTRSSQLQKVEGGKNEKISVIIKFTDIGNVKEFARNIRHARGSGTKIIRNVELSSRITYHSFASLF